MKGSEGPAPRRRRRRAEEQAKLGTQPKNVFRQRAKLTEDQLMMIAYNFCHGLPIAAAAKSSTLSEKTVRSLYILLRRRLLRPRFAEWHRANRALTNISDPDVENMMRSVFFDAMSRCYNNQTCWRNYEAGNRKNRLCQKCPLRDAFTNDDNLMLSLNFIDLIRNVYRSIGIGIERGQPSDDIFRERAIHTATLMTVFQNTRRNERGVLNHGQAGALSFRRLFMTMIEDLSEDPL